MQMWGHAYKSIYVYNIYIYMCVCECVHLSVCVCTCVCVCVCRCARAYVCLHIMCECVSVHMCVFAHVNVCVCECESMSVSMHVHLWGERTNERTNEQTNERMEGEGDASFNTPCLFTVKFFPVAIDMSSNIFSSLHTLIELKFDRVLTSGGSATALDGVPIIEKMIHEASAGLQVWLCVYNVCG